GVRARQGSGAAARRGFPRLSRHRRLDLPRPGRRLRSRRRPASSGNRTDPTMNKRMLSRLPRVAAAVRIAAAIVLSYTAVSALAQAAWPNRPIRIVVPYAAGSSPDVIARIVSEKLSPRLGQPVVIENRAGAGGN